MERLVDLHVHLDGSLSLETVKELAARQGIEIQNDDILIKKLQVSKDCRDLNEYLTKFEYPLMLLQTIDSIEYAVYSLMKRQSEQNLLYSEIRFAPQLHTKKGLSQEEVVTAALKGRQKYFDEFGEVTYTEKTRAVIKVQDGCDRFCSYCIIPYARGRVRSRNPKTVIEEIEKIAKTGIKEVVITGIHIASYGKDFKEDYKLINLLEDINKIDGIERIRLGSIEPLLITEEFVERLKKLDKICHHFHLSLQSGCNETLKRMNRRYTTEQFITIVNRLRKAYSDVILTTDIIVGFPEESEEEFNKTYEFLEQIKFYKMHVFKYSPRKGTIAAKNKNQIDGNVKEERSKKLIELSDKNEKEYNESYIGKKVEVLFEEEKQGIYQGHTKNYILVKCKSTKNIENKILTVTCQKVENSYILGTL
mgnify:CR=1 FL=1